MNNKFKTDFLSFLLFVALFIIIMVSFIPVFLGQKKQTTTTLAQVSCEGWRCPGNQCVHCGENGWWDQGCWDFCGSNGCSQSQGACSPCGDISLYCRNSAQDSCIKNGYRCGNDSCGYPDITCGSTQPTNTPTPIPNPTSPISPTNGPSPTSVPSLTPSTGTTIQPTPTPCISQTNKYSPNLNDPTSFLLGLFYILDFTSVGKDPCNSNPTSTPSPPNSLTNTPVPTISGSQNQGISAIIELVQNIQTYCGGKLIRDKINCLDQFSMNPTAKVYLKNYVTLNGEIHCAEWAKINAVMLGYSYWGVIGNAMNLKKAPPPNGYIFIPKSPDNIQVGDHPVLTYGDEGHTGTVTEVLDNMNFKFAEANFDFNGGIRIKNFRMTQDNSDQLAGWIRKL